MIDKNFERKGELSIMLLQMAESLVEEGKNTNDSDITHLGNTMLLLSGIIINSEHVKLFADLCSMFSAKQLVEDFLRNGDSSTLLSKSDKSEKTINKQMDIEDIMEIIKNIRKNRDNSN